MTGRTDDRRKAYRKGLTSEWIAALYLVLKGYRIKVIRYRTKSGEIDIIARRRDVVAIVEVKARRQLADAHEAVSPHGQRRIENAALHWLARQPDHARLSLRFDIIAIVPGKWPNHIENAF